MQTHAAVTAALVAQLQQVGQTMSATANALGVTNVLLVNDIDGSYFQIVLTRISKEEYDKTRAAAAINAIAPAAPPGPSEPPVNPSRN